MLTGASPLSLTQVLAILLRLEFAKSYRNRKAFLPSLFFFGITAFLFSFALQQNTMHLQKTFPGVFWTLALLTFSLMMPSLIKEDDQDGTLALIGRSPLHMAWFIISKGTIHGISMLICFAFVFPLLGLLFQIDSLKIFNAFLLMTIAVFPLSFLTLWGSSLTLRSNTSFLGPFLILPFYIPFFVIGLVALETFLQGGDVVSEAFLLFIGMSLASLPFSITSTVWTLKRHF